MGLRAIAMVLLSLSSGARAESPIDGAIRALRKDSSLKVRAQAAIILGRRAAPDARPAPLPAERARAVAALRHAVAADDSPAVRLAAVGSLTKLGARYARSTLRAAADSDPDHLVRSAAFEALRDLGPVSFVLEEPAGSAGTEAKEALRDALARELKDRGFVLADGGELRLKPSVLMLDVDTQGAKTVIAVRASLVAVDDDGVMAAMLEGGARLSATGAVTDKRLGVYSAKALAAAAKTLCEDLAGKIGQR